MNDISERKTRDDNPVRRAGPGIILILLGLIFLLQQFGHFSLRNWWALFILIPALASLWSAFALLTRSGRFNEAVRGSLFGGLMILTVALIFLLELSWAVFWPLFVILPGLSMLFTAWPGEETPAGRFYRPWLAWTGLAVTLLGAGFLSQNLGVFDPARYLRTWWALPILLVALGGLVTTLRLALAGVHPWAVIGSLIGTVTVGIVGFVALLGIGWNLLTPLILIGIGILLVLGFFFDRRRA